MNWKAFLAMLTNKPMRTVATGHVNSGIRFVVLASEPMSADDLRSIGNLMHGGAIKVEETLDREQC